MLWHLIPIKTLTADLTSLSVSVHSSNMGNSHEKTNVFESVFASTTAGHFLREFCFSRSQFSPSGVSEVELADFIVLLDDLFMVFQVKSRERPTMEPDCERKWFERKVLGKATRQVRDTIKYLQECPPLISNDRGREVELPKIQGAESVVKIVIFNPGAECPAECVRHRFYQSKTAGFMHVFAASDWTQVLETLVTPCEIAEYLRFRETICRVHASCARSNSEKAIIGQFLAGADSAAPSSGHEAVVDNLLREKLSFDVLCFLDLFRDRITDGPLFGKQPLALLGAGDDYYPIILEIAKLPHTDMAAFTTRFGLGWERAGQISPPMRMVSSTGVGFLFAPVPSGLEQMAQNGLLNFVEGHMYEQRITRCIGVSFVNEGDKRLITWILIDHSWQHDSGMERALSDSLLRPVAKVWVPRYQYQPPKKDSCE